MPQCLDFDNKRAYFRSQLRSVGSSKKKGFLDPRWWFETLVLDSYPAWN